MSSVDSAVLSKESAGKKGGMKKDFVRPQQPQQHLKVQVAKKESNVPPSDTVGSFPVAFQDEEEGELTRSDLEHLETGRLDHQPTAQSSRFKDLPEELKRLLGGSVFETEEEFETTLQELKIEDEPLVLGDDGRACYYMPGDEHNAATQLIVSRFHRWACFVKGTAGENTNIKLGPSFPGAPPARKRRKPKTRLPDVALWGRSKCEVDEVTGEIAKPMRVFPTTPQPVVHPHVVIQVSIFNDEDYEIDAINDLATRAAAGQGAKPNLGVLIKLRVDPVSDEPAGFDIFYLPAGVCWSDAVNGTNGAKHVVYNRNGPDVLVTITKDDLGGIDLSIWQSIKNYFFNGNRGSKDFQLSMAELFGTLYSFIHLTVKPKLRWIAI